MTPSHVNLNLVHVSIAVGLLSGLIIQLMNVALIYIFFFILNSLLIVRNPFGDGQTALPLPFVRTVNDLIKTMR